eukprot:scaffold64789_cov45-Phaeocystis_antarctica.AAC.1
MKAAVLARQNLAAPRSAASGAASAARALGREAAPQRRSSRTASRRPVISACARAVRPRAAAVAAVSHQPTRARRRAWCAVARATCSAICARSSLRCSMAC